MTELYRGLLEIFVMRYVEQIESLRTHIRSHNLGVNVDKEFDIGVTGFWNLVLEAACTIFTIAFLMSAICLTTALVVVSYPFAAFINYWGWLLKNTKNPKGDSPVIIKQSDEQEKK